jgi:hypothetical protein
MADRSIRTIAISGWILRSLRLKNNRRFGPGGIFKSLGLLEIAISGFKFIQGSGIKSPGRAGLDTDWHFILFPSLQTEVALVHLGPRLRSELGGIIGAGLKAFAIAFFITQTSFRVNYDDPVFFPLPDGRGRAGGDTNRLQTLVTGNSQIADKEVWIFPFFRVKDPHPSLRTGRNIVPVFTSYLTGPAPGTTGLIKIESNLHDRSPSNRINRD